MLLLSCFCLLFAILHAKDCAGDHTNNTSSVQRGSCSSVVYDGSFCVELCQNNYVQTSGTPIRKCNNGALDHSSLTCTAESDMPKDFSDHPVPPITLGAVFFLYIILIIACVKLDQRDKDYGPKELTRDKIQERYLPFTYLSGVDRCLYSVSTWARQYPTLTFRTEHLVLSLWYRQDKGSTTFSTLERLTVILILGLGALAILAARIASQLTLLPLGSWYSDLYTALIVGSIVHVAIYPIRQWFQPAHTLEDEAESYVWRCCNPYILQKIFAYLSSILAVGGCSFVILYYGLRFPPKHPGAYAGWHLTWTEEKRWIWTSFLSFLSMIVINESVSFYGLGIIAALFRTQVFCPDPITFAAKAKYKRALVKGVTPPAATATQSQAQQPVITVVPDARVSIVQNRTKPKKLKSKPLVTQEHESDANLKQEDQETAPVIEMKQTQGDTRDPWDLENWRAAWIAPPYPKSEKSESRLVENDDEDDDE